MPLLIVDCPQLYDRPGGPYQDASGNDWPDNALRFGLLSYLAAVLAGASSPIAWRPRILHCNDWQTGLAPAYLRFMTGRESAHGHDHPQPRLSGHLSAADRAAGWVCRRRRSVRTASSTTATCRSSKRGLYYADHITTVSPHYARRSRASRWAWACRACSRTAPASLTGILNGIDTDAWDPETDPYIARYYNAVRLPAKQENKRALQVRMGSRSTTTIPLLGIDRPAHAIRKGFDLLVEIAPALLELPAQLAILGSGDAALQDALLALAQSQPGQSRRVHRLRRRHGASDRGRRRHLPDALALRAVRAEPDVQPALRHAAAWCTTPAACTTRWSTARRADAGRQDAQPASCSRRRPRTALLAAVERAVAAYRDKKIWRQLQKNGMARDFSWERSAQRYIELYESLLRGFTERHRTPAGTRRVRAGLGVKLRFPVTARAGTSKLLTGRRSRMIGDRIEVNIAGGLDIPLPRMVHIRQKFNAAEARQREPDGRRPTSSAKRSAPRSSRA